MITTRIAAVVLWAVALPVPAQSQTATTPSTESRDGLTTLAFQTPAGVIRANFPSDLAAGDTISGTVTDEPTGGTPEERSVNSATLTGYVIETQNRQTTPHDRRATWIIPPGTTLLTVLLSDPHGTPVARGTIPVAPAAIPDPSTLPRTGDDFDLPRIGAGSGRYPIGGRFTGDARNTEVSVGGKPAEVLAESPRRAVFLAPSGISGPEKIELREKGLTVTGEFRAISVQLRGDTRLNRGQTAPLTITVSGLAGITRAMEMTLENRSTGVVLVSGGQLQKFRIAPSEVNASGVYTTTRTMTGVRRGNFDISAFVRQEPLERFDPKQSVQRVLQTWQSNNGIPITPGAQIQIMRSVLAAKDDLNQLLNTHGGPSNSEVLLSSLVRSYCFQLRDYKSGILTASAFERPPAVVHSPFALAFQAGASAVAQPITEQDVTQHSFRSFLSNFMSSLSGTTQLSPLAVCSVPDAALIVIDGKRMGATTSSFVISTGQHLVEIEVPGRACKVKARAGQDLAVSCPKTVPCK